MCLAMATAVAQPGPGRVWASDKRAEDRTYHFADTNENLPYCVFASSKISADKPAPLIVSLHGLGAPPQVMCNTSAVDLAEEGGYILVAPMGYNVSGWYGSPVITPGGGNNRAPTIEFGTINQGGEGEDDHLTLDEVAFFANGPGTRGNFAETVFKRWDVDGDGVVTKKEFDNRPQQARPAGAGGVGGDNQPENLTELSEKRRAECVGDGAQRIQRRRQAYLFNWSLHGWCGNFVHGFKARGYLGGNCPGGAAGFFNDGKSCGDFAKIKRQKCSGDVGARRCR
jgi:hypothetical protein